MRAIELPAFEDNSGTAAIVSAMQALDPAELAIVVVALDCVMTGRDPATYRDPADTRRIEGLEKMLRPAFAAAGWGDIL